MNCLPYIVALMKQIRQYLHINRIINPEQISSSDLQGLMALYSLTICCWRSNTFIDIASMKFSLQLLSLFDLSIWGGKENSGNL